MNKVCLYGIDTEAINKVMSNLTGLGLDVIACTTLVEAISGAEIIITYSAGKQCVIIFSDNMIGAGVNINAIGEVALVRLYYIAISCGVIIFL